MMRHNRRDLDIGITDRGNSDDHLTFSTLDQSLALALPPERYLRIEPGVHRRLAGVCGGIRGSHEHLLLLIRRLPRSIGTWAAQI